MLQIAEHTRLQIAEHTRLIRSRAINRVIQVPESVVQLRLKLLISLQSDLLAEVVRPHARLGLL